MRRLNTVCGSIGADEVGLICPHEHLFIDMTHEAVEPKTEEAKKLFYGDIQMKDLGTLRRNPYIVKTNLVLDDIDTAVGETECLADYGCNLLVDLTTVGLGRDMTKILAFSKRSKLNVITGTGLMVHDSSIPKTYESKTVSQLADWILGEIEYGHCDTGIRPGVIGEIGTSEVIYPIEERMLHASAIASVKMNLPVYVHTFPWSRAGLDAVDLLLNEGVAPENICICHLDVTFDNEYILEVLKRGIYLEFDNFSKEFYFEPQEGAFSGGPFATDVARVDKLRELIRDGYTDQLLLANDVCLKESLRCYGGWGYDHIFKNIVPMMRMEGIPEDAIRQIVRVNPKRFLFQV